MIINYKISIIIGSNYPNKNDSYVDKKELTTEEDLNNMIAMTNKVLLKDHDQEKQINTSLSQMQLGGMFSYILKTWITIDDDFSMHDSYEIDPNDHNQQRKKMISANDLVKNLEENIAISPKKKSKSLFKTKTTIPSKKLSYNPGSSLLKNPFMSIDISSEPMDNFYITNELIGNTLTTNNIHLYIKLKSINLLQLNI